MNRLEASLDTDNWNLFVNSKKENKQQNVLGALLHISRPGAMGKDLACLRYGVLGSSSSGRAQSCSPLCPQTACSAHIPYGTF